MSAPTLGQIVIGARCRPQLTGQPPEVKAGRWNEFSCWLRALADGLGHKVHCLEAVADGRICGLLPLAHVSSPLFGQFLVSLPYVNTAGVVADQAEVGHRLIDRAVELADALDVRYLELRHEEPWEHPALNQQLTTKVHMRLPLPGSPDELRKQLKSKVRNQVVNAEKKELSVRWGRHQLLDDFYRVFSHNMRDLGTPVYPRRLFSYILEHFPEAAELCTVYAGTRPIAAALLIHGSIGVTQVPSASSLRQFNHTNANMLMYWHLLRRAVERGQHTFDFGRSTIDSNTFRFKKQWGADPMPAVWQYYVRRGTAGDMRPEHSRYQRLIRIWQKLPVGLTRLIGPPIARAIP
jgi:FemAB-related protein (PEP-CTERM system-associated)